MLYRSPEGNYSGPSQGRGHASDDNKPVLVMALGRGRVGKTAFLNAVAQFYREAGANLEIWNIDRHNQTDSLDKFFPDVRSPQDFAEQDSQRWLEARIADQSKQGYDALLDVGGGDTQIKKLAKEVDLGALLERRGIRPVAVHVLGPDAADLDYLRQVSLDRLFMPAATVIVLNSGLIGNRSVRGAFDPITRDPVVVEAMSNGAQVVMMPELACMRGVLDRHLTFRAVADDERVEFNPDPLSFFDQERVAIWWDKRMPELFRALPVAWMPRIPAGSYDGTD